MRILVDSKEMKACDTCTIEYRKVPSMVLMERAALSVVEEISRRGLDTGKCLVLCGTGNNGGDGLAIARLLFQKGCDVTVFCDVKKKKASQQFLQQYEILEAYGISVINEFQDKKYTLIIDAVFGIGLSRPVEGFWKDALERVNTMTGYKLAVDIPSGISADTGQLLGCGFQADMTVTFAYEKVGLLLFPGSAYAGNLVVKDIGVDAYSWQEKEPHMFLYENLDLKRLPLRPAYSNKGTYGKVLVVGGSHNMAGAAYFSGKAAAVTGCGLVKFFTTEDNRGIIQQLLPEAILTTYSEDELENDHLSAKLKEAISWADVMVLGPGMGNNAKSKKIVATALRQTKIPTIVDADALNILAENPKILLKCHDRLVVTPHLGEMARLTKGTISEIQESLIKVAGTFAKDYNVICVLKDARTITALPDNTLYINTSGNSGMATAGSGDVLTGVIAGLIAQGMHPEEAAPMGVFLHGKAGDAMVAKTGYYGMLATDLIEGIRKITRKEMENEHL